MLGWLRLEGISMHSFVSFLAQSRVSYRWFLCPLSIVSTEDSITSLEILLQWLTTLTVKSIFLCLS